MSYKARTMETALRSALNTFRVVGVTGPRQSGKSTLLQNVLKDYDYVTFDDYRSVQQFEADPERFMTIHDGKTIFDEAQKAPALFDRIKIEVDRYPKRYGHYVLTGSARFTMMKSITESLAGRLGLLELLPFQYAELPKALRTEAIFQGSYPELVNHKYEGRNAWYASYIETYLTRDLYQLASIGDLRDFRRLIELLAANCAQQLNYSRYASDIGVSVPTIKRWVGVLEASYIIFLLPSWHKKPGKRIVKSPKIYFYDTGLISFLTGIETRALYENGPMAGALFENYLVAEALKREKHSNTFANLYYMRTAKGEEVDLIIDRKSSREFIEIKRSETFRTTMLQHVEKFKGKSDAGVLVFEGESMPYTKDMRVVNWEEWLAE